MSFKPSGIITLTTDFGHKGPFTATMKGMMLRRFAGAQIIDLTHDIEVHWPAEAGFWLAKSYAYFPKGTVHCAVVDPGVGTERRVIVAELDGHVFMAPDNGLLAPLLADNKRARIYAVDMGHLNTWGIHEPSATFHGRDVFAPLAAEIAAGRCSIEDLGSPTRELVPSWVEAATADANKVSGVVITVDHFGNLFTNIDGKLLERFSHARVHAGGHDIPLRRTYGDVTPGDYLALINSFGVLELARAEQSAADGLGLSRGAPVVVREGQG